MSKSYPDQPRVGVAAVVWRAGRVLLIQRNQPPKSGEWSLPGGSLELGETLAAGAAREVLEETGCVVTVGPVITAAELIDRDDGGAVRFHYVLVDLVATWVSGEAHAATDAGAVAWATLDELPAFNLWPVTEQVIRQSAEMRSEYRGASIEGDS